jgi:hypothetical protein
MPNRLPSFVADPARRHHAPRQANENQGSAKGQVAAAILDHHFDHHCTLFGPARHRSPTFRMPVDLA